jgi:hypothetical protein
MSNSFASVVTATAIAWALAGCQTPAGIANGTTEAQAVSSLGTPTARIPLANGDLRLQYSGQPSQQSVWNLDFDSAGRLVRREQMMTDAAFSTIRSGKSTQQDIVRDFGPPADVQTYPLKKETSYMYRYYMAGGFPAAMFVNFDPAGVVVGTQTGLDPYMLGGGDRR